MKKQKVSTYGFFLKRKLLLITALVVSMQVFAFADEADEKTKTLLNRIDALEKKVESLNRKLEMQSTLEASKIGEEIVEKKVQAALDKRKEAVTQTMDLLKGINISGFVRSEERRVG